MSANTKISSNNNPSCISDVSGHVPSSETNNPLFKYPIVKLIDFGFANSWQEGHKLKTSCGSLAYSAPEILLGEWHVDLTDKPSNWTCVCLSVSDNIGIRSEFTSTKRLQKWHYEIMLSCQCIRFFDDKIWTWNSISWRFCYSMLSFAFFASLNTQAINMRETRLIFGVLDAFSTFYSTDVILSCRSMTMKHW